MFIRKNVHVLTTSAALALGTYADTADAALDCEFDIPVSGAQGRCSDGIETALVTAFDSSGNGTVYSYSVSLAAGQVSASIALLDGNGSFIVDTSGNVCRLFDLEDDGDPVGEDCAVRAPFAAVSAFVEVD